MLCLLVAFQASVVFGYSQSTSQSKIKNVSIYQNSALIVADTEPISFTKGFNSITISGITQGVDQNSLSLKCDPTLKVLKTIVIVDVLPIGKDKIIAGFDKEIASLQDSLKWVEFALKRNEILKKTVYDNREIEVSDRSIYVDDLDELLVFLKLKLRNLENEKEKRVYHRNTLNYQIDSLKTAKQNRIATLGYPKASITAQISAENDIKTPLQLFYKTEKADWTPKYIIALDQEKSTLNFRADVAQSSGLNWTDVNTALVYGENGDMNRPCVTMNINKNVSISNGDSAINIDVRKFDIECKQIFKVNPSKKSFALLEYQVTGLRGEYLPQGPVTFISSTGQQHFDTLESTLFHDSVSYQFGYVNDITFERTLSKEKLSRALIGNKHSVEVEWTLNVINNSSEDQLIEITDFLPNNKENIIGLELNLPKNAITTDNEFSFSDKLKPGEEKDYTYGFKITAPKGENLNDYYEN